MSRYNLKDIKLNLYNIDSFEYPRYSIIDSIKITNLNVFTKIISKNNILVYGNYDVIINYKNILFNNCTSKEQVKYRKVFFHKPLYCYIPKLYIFKALKSEVTLLSKPILIYSLKTPPCFLSKNINLCKVTLFLSLSISIYKNKYSSNYNHINSNYCNDSKDIYNANFSNTFSSNSKKNNTLDNNIKEDSEYLFKPKNSPTIDDNSNLPIAISDISSNEYSKPSSVSINHYCNINKFPLRQLIETDVIIGHGYSKIFLDKTIHLPDSATPIWKIHKVCNSSDINKISINCGKAFIDGFANIDVVYNSLITSDNSNVNGNIYYIHSVYPFSLCIDLTPEGNKKFKNSDKCNVSNVFISEIHKTNNPSPINGEDVYYEFNTQFIVEINILVTRTMELYI